MARSIPWDDIPKPGANFPVGVAHLFAIESLELTESKSGKAMVKATLRCVEPSPGQICYENFTIGNEDDPQGVDPKQLQKNYSMQLLTDLLKHAKAKLLDSLERTLEKAAGKQLGVIFKQEIDKQSGEPRSRPGTYFIAGEMAPGTDVAKAGGKGKAAPPKAAAKPPKQAPPPDDDDDEDEDEPAPPKAKKKATAPPPDDDDDDEDDD